MYKQKYDITSCELVQNIFESKVSEKDNLLKSIIMHETVMLNFTESGL